jgi:nucleoside-diphosphate-sugar epimerase
VSKVVVTGAGGFIGTALVPRLLATGHLPRLFVRWPPAAPLAAPAEVMQGDLTSAASLRAAVEGADAVVHLGAATSAGRLDPALAYRVNVGGATALIEACRAAGCRRVVVLSTQHVYLKRCGAYGRTKRIADALFSSSGLEVTILRPSLVYGRGSRGVFMKLTGLLRRLPMIPVVGPGTWHLRPVYLGDLVELIVQTLARPEVSGRTYDVGGPERITYTGFLGAICAALGRPCRRVHIPLVVGFALAWLLERLLANPPLTVDNVYGSLLDVPCDLRALMRDFHPTLTPLAVGLRRTFAEAT